MDGQAAVMRVELLIRGEVENFLQVTVDTLVSRMKILVNGRRHCENNCEDMIFVDARRVSTGRD